MVGKLKMLTSYHKVSNLVQLSHEIKHSLFASQVLYGLLMVLDRFLFLDLQVVHLQVVMLHAYIRDCI